MGPAFSERLSARDAAYRPGSSEDFDRLYRSSYARLVRTLAGVLGSVPAAEDCVQETFVRAYTAWPRWNPDAPAEAWLHRIAVNVAASHRRYQRLREVGQLLRRVGRPEVKRDPAAVADRSDLLDAIRRLPPRQAAAIILRHYHGYTNREIAVVLKVPERTVASRLATARGRLRRELGNAWNPRMGTSGDPGVLHDEKPIGE
jgi:RNA polymerase sigma-70 factor (ECF subfamily)